MHSIIIILPIAPSGKIHNFLAPAASLFYDTLIMDYSQDPFILDIQLRRDQIAHWDQHPFAVPAIRILTTLAIHPQVTFFVGENGTGKSTLLEAIAIALGLNAEGGSRNMTFNTSNEQNLLAPHLHINRGRNLRRPRDSYFLRAESYFNVATEIDTLDAIEAGDAPKLIAGYGHKSLHHQSHGESFLTLLTYRLGGNGIYLFDEPEAALSPMRQMSMITALHQLIQRGSQLIIATHSPILLAYPNATLYHFNQNGIHPITYEQTDHYQITHAFINRHQKMIKELTRD